MPDQTLIPPSPSQADYEAADRADAPLLDPRRDPLDLFAVWMAEAVKSEPNDPNAMTLATVDAGGAPDARIVLLKALDERGFSFFTNLTSAKGQELAAHPRAALVFHWKSLRRQVRVRGAIERVSDAEADAYFATRSRVSRLGAWASDQSKTLSEPAVLHARLKEMEQRFKGVEPPRPPHWSGYRLIPEDIEFWLDGAFRLHERLLFERRAEGSPWNARRLFP
jgi:pyridoxamine 5'-phosphate oxidase